MVTLYMSQQYITQEDLNIINAALEKGETVQIRRTTKGIKIATELVRLLKMKQEVRVLDIENRL